MKPATMILGFLPWIAFGIVVQLIGPQSVALSALLGIGLVLAGTVITRELRSPNQMAVGSLIPLSAIAILALITGDDVHEWLFTWAVPGQALVLGAFLLAMLPIAPFTRRYARSTTPRAYWTSPLFVRTNLIMSAAWGVAMVALGACNILGSAMEAYADEFGDLAEAQPYLGLVSLAVIAGIITFTKVYPARVRRSTRAAATLALTGS
jgi:hypothetical protein